MQSCVKCVFASYFFPIFDSYCFSYFFPIFFPKINIFNFYRNSRKLCIIKLCDAVGRHFLRLLRSMACGPWGWIYWSRSEGIWCPTCSPTTLSSVHVGEVAWQKHDPDMETFLIAFRSFLHVRQLLQLFNW